MRLSPRHPWILAGALAFLALVLTFDPKLYINGDNADYMNLARAARHGHLWASDKYPPLFPLLLAPVQALFGMRLLPQKLLVLAFGGGAIWLLAGIIRRRVSARCGPWLLLAAATLIPFVEYAHYVMSEVPFLFFQLGAVDACDRMCDEARSRPAGRETIRLALWIAAAFYIRTAGVALAGGVLLWLLLTRRSRHALLLTGALGIAAVPWLLHAFVTGTGSPYLHQLLRADPYAAAAGALGAGSLLRRVAENARVYFLWLVPATVLPARYGSTYSLPDIRTLFYPPYVAVPLLIPFGLGLWRNLRPGGRRRSGMRPDAVGPGNPTRERGADPATCVVVATLALLCLWPSIWAGSRFLVPIVPLLPVIWWNGWMAAEEIGCPGPWAQLRAVILVVLIALGVRNLGFYVRETRDYPPPWANYLEALAWVGQHTPAQAVIIDRKPGFVEFLTGRKALMFPREKDPRRMLEEFRRNGVTHVVVGPLPFDDIQRYLVPAIDGEQSHFQLLHRTAKPRAYVFEFHPEGGMKAPDREEQSAGPP